MKNKFKLWTQNNFFYRGIPIVLKNVFIPELEWTAY